MAGCLQKYSLEDREKKMKPGKVVIIVPYARPENGAAVVRAHSMADFFSGLGVQSEVWAPERGGLKTGNGVFRYSSIRELFLKILWSDATLVIGTSPPVTHNFYAAIACKLSGKTFFLDAKDPFTDIMKKLDPKIAQTAKFRWHQAIEYWAHRMADRVMFLNETLRQKAVLELHVPKQKVFVASNGTLPDRIFPDKKEAQRVRKKFGIPENAPVLVYAGGIGDKSLDAFFEKSLDILTKQGAYFFVIVSLDQSLKNRGLFEKIQRIANEKKAQNRVFFITNLSFEELNPYFAASDFGLVPYPAFEMPCLGTKVFDYISSGLFVLAKAHEKNLELKDFLEKNRAGLFASNWTRFNESLSQALGNVELYRENRGAIRKLALRNTREEQFKKIWHEYHGICTRARRRQEPA
jgi:glycosyltransferase involved in cell wall biosynthesis